MTAPARRPWLRKKRWAAAGLLWLALIYVASAGPAEWLLLRCPVQYRPAIRWAYAPVSLTMEVVGFESPPVRASRAYLEHWH